MIPMLTNAEIARRPKVHYDDNSCHCHAVQTSTGAEIRGPYRGPKWEMEFWWVCLKCGGHRLKVSRETLNARFLSSSTSVCGSSE